MPSPAQKVIASITVFLGLVACALLLQQSIDVSIQSWLIQEVRHGVTQTPFWPARFVVSFGLLIFCIQLAIDFTRDLGVKW
jgi:TRAP-type C4-dicarboxylate transport system permease small subunit